MALVDWGLVNIIDYFLPRRQYQGEGGWTWCMHQEGQRVTGRGGSILSADRRNFNNVGLQEQRHSKDHRMVLAVLHGKGELRNHRY